MDWLTRQGSGLLAARIAGRSQIALGHRRAASASRAWRRGLNTRGHADRRAAWRLITMSRSGRPGPGEIGHTSFIQGGSAATGRRGTRDDQGKASPGVHEFLFPLLDHFLQYNGI